MDEFIQGKLAPLQEIVREAPTSQMRFDTGGDFRVEIPSVEGVAAFEAVLEAATSLDVPVHRVSQGSGIMLLRDIEIERLAVLGAENGIEVCLFVGPRAPWEGSAASLTPDGKYVGWRHTRIDQLRYAYDDVVRAVRLGIRSVLVADEGLITLINDARLAGALPPDLVVKASAIMGISNALGARLLEHQGVDTINILSDTPLGEIAAFRSLCSAPLDLYVESPDGLGGATRYHELSEIVRVAAPVHLKFGLRNAPNLYPSGDHLEGTAVATGRERVRRAAIGLEMLHRSDTGAEASPHESGRRGLPVIKRP